MKRPMFWFLIFLIVGILSGQYISDRKCIALVCIGIIVLCIFLYKGFRTKLIIILPLIYLFGVFQINFYGADRLILSGNTNIIGLVRDVGYTNSGRQKLTLEVTDENKKAVVQAVLEPGQNYLIGDILSISGEIEQGGYPRNPGEFNEYIYFKTKNIDYKIYPEFVSKIGDKDMILKSLIADFRDKVIDVYFRVLPANEAGIITAMIVGNDNELDDDIREVYTASGIVHIIAISGLHVGIITVFLFWLLNDLLNLRKDISSALTIVLIFAYMFFTGCHVSTVRAVIMATVVLLGNIVYKDPDSINTISLAAIILIVFNPYVLWRVGFQLSFTIVTGIICANKIFRLYKGMKGRILRIIGIPIIASVVSYPIVAYYFYDISLVGIISNIVIIPLVSLVVVIGFVIGIMGMVSINVAMFLSGSVYLLLRMFYNICEFLISLPLAVVCIGRPKVITILLFYLLLFAIYKYKYNKIYVKVSIPLILFAIVFSIIDNRLIYKNIEITFLDVGQGDCSIINTYDNNTFIIDGGGSVFRELGNNTGVRTLYPYLRYKGIQFVDILFITHLDSDHALGAIELLDLIDVGKVVVSDYTSTDTELKQMLDDAASRNNVPIVAIKRGDSLEISDDIVLECIYPTGTNILDTDDDNSYSLVMKLTYKDTSFMFTGDIGIQDEWILSTQEDDVLSADVLKLSHHGSKYSSSKVFIEKVNPDIGIVSSGVNNIYGHPHYETLERFKGLDTKIINTAESGTIIIKSDGENITVNTTLKVHE